MVAELRRLPCGRVAASALPEIVVRMSTLPLVIAPRKPHADAANRN
jgi:hypothetical protein